MPGDKEFKAFVLDQLSDLGAFETRAMFGGTALLIEGAAFAKIRHGALWLKVGNANRTDFVEKDMPQYTYGRDNARKLNFFRTPTDVLEDADTLVAWASKSVDEALTGQARRAGKGPTQSTDTAKRMSA